MTKEAISLTLEIMTATGTFCAGIAALFGIIKLIKNVAYRNEILFGAEAEERFCKFEAAPPKKARLIGEYPFSGGTGTITPQLKIMRLYYNRQTMPAEYKGYKQTLRYITQDKKETQSEKSNRTERVWLLK